MVLKLCLALALFGAVSAGQAQTRVFKPAEADQKADVPDCNTAAPESYNLKLVVPYDIQICFDSFVIRLKSVPPAGEPWRIPTFVANRIVA